MGTGLRKKKKKLGGFPVVSIRFKNGPVKMLTYNVPRTLRQYLYVNGVINKRNQVPPDQIFNFSSVSRSLGYKHYQKYGKFKSPYLFEYPLTVTYRNGNKVSYINPSLEKYIDYNAFDHRFNGG